MTSIHQFLTVKASTGRCMTHLQDLQRGTFIRVSTSKNSKTGRWESSFNWLWIRANGMSFSWLEGDPVGKSDAYPEGWSVSYPNGPDRLDKQGIPQVHHDSCKRIIELMTGMGDNFPKPTYSGVAIPNIFESMGRTVLAAQDPMMKKVTKKDDMLDFFASVGIPIHQATAQDMAAIAAKPTM